MAYPEGFDFLQGSTGTQSTSGSPTTSPRELKLFGNLFNFSPGSLNRKNNLDNNAANDEVGDSRGYGQEPGTYERGRQTKRSRSLIRK